MASGLDAIFEELKRLEDEGVDRVFVADATMAALRGMRGGSAEPVAAGVTPVKEKTAPDASPLDAFEDLSNAVATAPKLSSAQEKPSPVAKPAAFPPPPLLELPDGDAATQMDWLRQKVESCEVCRAHLREGGKVVFGTGADDADIFFCGEAPGADEEKAGEPFVGPAGQLLTKIIAAMGLSRDAVYIANILKWRPEHDRPTGNRPPTEAEMRFCLPYLKAQLAIVRPKVVVALGNTAVTGLLGADPHRRLGQVRGKWHAFDAIPLMITFHPSYLLRNGSLQTKRLVWEDMLKVMEKIGLPISEKQRGYFLKN